MSAQTKRLIDRDKLFIRLYAMHKQAWSTSEANATLCKVEGIVKQLDLEQNEPCSMKKIEFGYWDFDGWDGKGLHNVYKCSGCGYKTLDRDLIWCPVCGRLNDPDEKKRIAQMQEQLAERKQCERFVERPMSTYEVGKTIGRPIFIELRERSQDRFFNCGLWGLVTSIDLSRNDFGDTVVSDFSVMSANQKWYFIDTYNHDWRGWRTLPNDEERKAAAWDED